MGSVWEDFENPNAKQEGGNIHVESSSDQADDNNPKDCDWGFAKPDLEPDTEQSLSTECAKFINLYENYLSDKQSLDQRTSNHQLFANNPSRALREWFDNEGHEYSHKLEQLQGTQYRCSIDVPVGSHDFRFESATHPKKQMAIDEVCLAACKLLDECDMLKSWQQDLGSKDPDRKRRLDEAIKEDDIELDNTKSTLTNSHEPKPKRNTLESLTSKWKQLNTMILGLKARLVKIDLSVTKDKSASGRADTMSKEEDGGEDEDEEDPLDAFMSNLDKKTELTLDEKIEKSHLKSQIRDMERQQDEISVMINDVTDNR